MHTKTKTKPKTETAYLDNGYKSRADYLSALAEEYSPATVYALADLLGEGEDFDALPTMLEDFEDEEV